MFRASFKFASGSKVFGLTMLVWAGRRLSGNSIFFQKIGGNHDHLFYIFGGVIPNGKTDERTTGNKKEKIIGR